ncbi:MAG: nucleoside hydrolase [Spirochaetota bacterium]
MARPVILDTDLGSDIDDTWALVMLLRSPELDVKLIVTETCDTAYRAAVTAKLLEVAGRSDIPVGIGIRFSPCNEFQAPWLGDYELDAYPGPVHEDGVAALIETVRASEEPVTIIAIGPSPNIRAALERAPDIAPRCRFVGMFGSVDRGYGPGSEPVAETNVREDVAAAKAIFAAPWRDMLITPLDTCDLAVLTDERYAAIRDSDDPLLAALMANTRAWSKLVSWMDASFIDHRSSTLFDTVAVYLAYSEELVEVEEVRLSVTDEGMTVRDPSGHRVRVAMRWRDLDGYLDHLAERLRFPTQPGAQPSGS